MHRLMMAVAAAVALSSSALAATFYVGPGSSCTDCGTCGSQAQPLNSLQTAHNCASGNGVTQPDVIVALSSQTPYECVNVFTSNVTIQAQSPLGSTISRIACPELQTVLIRGNDVTLTGFRITAAAADAEIRVWDTASNVTLSNLEVIGNPGNGTDGIHVDNTGTPTTIANVVVHDNGVRGIQAAAPSVTISNSDIHHNGNDGILINGNNPVVIDSHIHHNGLSGILEGGVNAVIRGNDIHDNGTDFRFHHGVYLTGTGGTLSKNRIHHNAMYGVHLFHGPTNWTVEHNEVFSNGQFWDLPIPNQPTCTQRFLRAKGGGIVVAGDGTLIPSGITIRYNIVHHNVQGVAYQAFPNQTPAANVFHHNTIFMNGDARGNTQVTVLSPDPLFEFQDNLVIANDLAAGTVPMAIVDDPSASFPANAFNGNLYFRPGGSSGDPLFSWDGVTYGFNGLAALGQEAQSLWSADYRLVDGGMAPHTFGARPTNGDYHLRVGSTAATPACQFPADGEKDYDDDPVSSPCKGIGADYYKDSDLDGIADRYDGGNKVVDGDAVPDTKEFSKCSHPGAAYLPDVFPAHAGSPGAPELCDGLDNDCFNGIPSNEMDGDRDGVFTGCGVVTDCNDSNARMYGGAQQFCDGIDNPSCGGTPAGEMDADDDGYFICFQPPFSVDCNDTNCHQTPESTEICDNQIDDDCDGFCDTGDSDCGGGGPPQCTP